MLELSKVNKSPLNIHELMPRMWITYRKAKFSRTSGFIIDTLSPIIIYQGISIRGVNVMVGILGCGTIANIITNFTAEGKLGVDLEFFYDMDMERAENLASQ